MAWILSSNGLRGSARKSGEWAHNVRRAVLIGAVLTSNAWQGTTWRSKDSFYLQFKGTVPRGGKGMAPQSSVSCSGGSVRLLLTFSCPESREEECWWSPHFAFSIFVPFRHQSIGWHCPCSEWVFALHFSHPGNNFTGIPKGSTSKHPKFSWSNPANNQN